jgi:hypothetical protein
MVRLSPDLSQYVGVRDTAKQLYCSELGTLYKALSADASTAYGLSPVFVVHDELGQVRGPRSELYEALETASGAQEEPLSFVISTQARTDADLLSLLIDDALRGEDPRTKVMLYTAPEDLDPFSDEAIRLAAPHFDVFMNQQEVQGPGRGRAPDAEQGGVLPEPDPEPAHQRHQPVHLAAASGRRAAASRTGRARGGPRLHGPGPVGAQRPDGGRAVAQDEDGVWHVESKFFAPGGVLERSHRDRVPYDQWAADGHIELTPGASVDYEVRRPVAGRVRR